MNTRTILKVTGSDARDFLQGLVTNDVARLSDGLVYAAMLTPQGKYLADFFMVPDGAGAMIDVNADLAQMLAGRLNMYKLRADVTVEATDLCLHRGLGQAPDDGFVDPRHADLGWRAYRADPQTDDTTDWDALHVAHVVPRSGVELSGDTFILEAGFERLNGVDFRKGCYVGQEVTARMKHKTELRKGLATVEVAGHAPVGTQIMANGKPAGTLFSQSGDRAIAYLRFDRATDDMVAGDAAVRFHREG